MQLTIEHRPGAAVAVCALAAGEAIRAESDAMVSMSGPVAVKTEGARASGGLMRGLGRMVLGGESFFTNLFTAEAPAEVVFAPSLPGDMAVHDIVPGQELFIQGGSFVAAPDSVQLDTKWQGLGRGMFSGESFFFLRARGQGPVVLNAFGGNTKVAFDGEMFVDTGHLVAFTSGIDYQVTKASSGWIAAYLSGEGFVLKLRGRGDLYLQTRNPTEFGRIVGAMLPPR